MQNPRAKDQKTVQKAVQAAWDAASPVYARGGGGDDAARDRPQRDLDRESGALKTHTHEIFDGASLLDEALPPARSDVQRFVRVFAAFACWPFQGFSVVRRSGQIWDTSNIPRLTAKHPPGAYLFQSTTSGYAQFTPTRPTPTGHTSTRPSTATHRPC